MNRRTTGHFDITGEEIFEGDIVEDVAGKYLSEVIYDDQDKKFFLGKKAKFGSFYVNQGGIGLRPVQIVKNNI